MIASDRDIFVGAHLTLETKEKLREEAKKRRISMSHLISLILEQWLTIGATIDFLEVAERSNKRPVKRPVNPNEQDIPLPFEK